MQKVPKGLEGVIFTETRISKIDGAKGILIYRGYDATELANLQFEKVAHLLLIGKLPDSDQLHDFSNQMRRNRTIPDQVIDFLKSAPKDADPLSVLRTASSMLGMYSKGNITEKDSGISLTAKLPVMNAFYNRIRNGQGLIEPESDLSHAENYLRMISGKDPSAEMSAALNSYLILLSDHGMNASTFSCRVTISTLSDMYSAIVSAIGTLKGPLHGGAPSEVWEMLQEIGEKSRSKSWLEERVKSGGRIMGFGHRVYRTQDPRSRVLKEIAKKIADHQIFELASAVEGDARALLQARHPERPLDTNVEFYSSLVLHAVGIPADMFTSTFSCGRVVGWTAHALEQLSDNRLVRPSSEYVGPEGLVLTQS